MKDMDKCDACIASGQDDSQFCYDCLKTIRRHIKKEDQPSEKTGGENERG